MDTILQDLIGALADATDFKGMGYVLKNIRQHLLETDSTGWDYVVDEVISRINEIAKLKREKYIEGPNHKPYYIASGKEADLLYIASVLTDHLNGNPAYIMKAYVSNAQPWEVFGTAFVLLSSRRENLT